MKYESDLIKEIVDSRGHEKSSLHYQSECVESWVEESKGSYPKLCDYESEWLNYINDEPIGKFPYVTLTDVTETTVDHVVPYAYKSAILTGQTLVNLAKVRSATTYNVCSEKNIVIKPNTKYIAMFNPTYGEGTGRVNYALLLVSSVSISNSVVSGDVAYTQSVSGGKGSEYEVHKGDRYLIFTSKDNESYIHIRTGGEIGVTYTDMIILEYQDGMENWDIPYFEGMQSVKMAVLTTTGKNLFDGNLIGGYFNNNISSITGDDGKYKSIKIKLNKGTYTLSFERPVYVIREIIDGVYNQNVKTVTTYTFTLNTDGYYGISFRDAVSGTIWSQTQVMIEQGTVATSYEPYKTNILSCNEEVTLRGIGDVKDKLDLMTGELTQRITEIVLSGSEKWSLNRATINHNLWETTIANPAFNSSERKNNMLCNKLIVEDYAGLNDKDYEFITINNGNSNMIYLKLDKTKVSSVTELKNYLQSNPLTIQYQLATESIKTVDLSITNQDGESMSKIKPIEGTMYLSTSSDTIPPLFSGEIPVEAITQNLASFIGEE